MPRPPQSPIEASSVPAEPFGQHGVRHLILPAISLALLGVASIAGVMWWRSQSIADVLRNNSGDSVYSIRSAYGRISFVRRDLRPAAQNPADAGWDYDLSALPRLRNDPWPDSWAKTIGLEWQTLDSNRAITGGWALRIRWLLIMVLAGATPLVRSIKRTIQQYRLARAP